MHNNEAKTCVSGKFKRLNYYHGMLLTEEDLQVEQNYFREKMKLHNRLHGYGVVWGLELTTRCIEIEGKPVWKIFIEPGFALDCAGNEIVVCHPHLIPIDERVDELSQRCAPLDQTAKWFVAIKYCERESEPRPQYTSQCAEDQQQPHMSRICEGYRVQVLDEVPQCCKDTHMDDCIKQYKQDCPGLAGCCEDEHVIVIGCVLFSPPAGAESIVNMSRSERNYAAENIDPCCAPRRVCLPCTPPQSQWERQKQALLHEVCLTGDDLIDCSGVVGKSISDAKSYLTEIGFENVDNTNVSSIKDLSPVERKELMEAVATAVPCADKGSAIKLITDKPSEDNGCVLFALPYVGL